MENVAVSSSDRPWLAVYPAQAPHTIETAPYGLLGEIARERAEGDARQDRVDLRDANGMAGSLSYSEVDALSDAFAAYLREELGLAAGERVAMQMPERARLSGGRLRDLQGGLHARQRQSRSTRPSEMAKIYADAEPAVLVIIDMFADRSSPRR